MLPWTAVPMVVAPIAGALADRIGGRPIVMSGLLTMAAGLGWFALVNEPDVSYLTQVPAFVLSGIGMAMFPIAFGIIREVLPEKKLGIGQTIFSSTFSGGAVVGLVGGAAIIQNFGWQATFLAILPPAIALWFAIVKFVRVPSHPMNGNGQTVDIKGALALAATIITFLAGITFLESASTGAIYEVAGLFAASGASLAAFIAIEK